MSLNCSDKRHKTLQILFIFPSFMSSASFTSLFWKNLTLVLTFSGLKTTKRVYPSIDHLPSSSFVSICCCGVMNNLPEWPDTNQRLSFPWASRLSINTFAFKFSVMSELSVLCHIQCCHVFTTFEPAVCLQNEIKKATLTGLTDTGQNEATLEGGEHVLLQHKQQRKQKTFKMNSRAAVETCASHLSFAGAQSSFWFFFSF